MNKIYHPLLALIASATDNELASASGTWRETVIRMIRAKSRAGAN